MAKHCIHSGDWGYIDSKGVIISGLLANARDHLDLSHETMRMSQAALMQRSAVRWYECFQDSANPSVALEFKTLKAAQGALTALPAMQRLTHARQVILDSLETSLQGFYTFAAARDKIQRRIGK